MEQTALKNSYYVKNESILKMTKTRQKGKGYSPCKILSLDKKKYPKTCERRF